MSVVAITLCLFLVLVSVPQASTVIFAETIAEKLQRLQKEKAAVEKEITTNKNEIKKATSLKNNYAQKAEIERQQLEMLAAAILEAEEALKVKQEEIATKILEFENTKKLFEDRLVAMYKKQDRSVIAAVLSVEDFSSLLRLTKNLKLIAKTDNEMMDLLQAQQAELEVLKAAIEVNIADLNAKKAEAEELKKQYEQSVINAQNKINQEQAEKQANEATYGDLNAKIDEAFIEYQKWISEETQGGEFIGGEFIWPVPTHKGVSSGFGVKRVINGRVDIHRGIDIPAPSGTPVYASANGKASVKGHHYTYGNCVKLSHGGGIVSVYAHLSAIAPEIYDGKDVLQGTIIGYVGSTGNSTGNHLHFEIDANGAPVNPYGYLSK